MDPKIDKKLENLKIRGAQKHGKKDSQQVAKSIKLIENYFPWGQGLELRKSLKIDQFSEFVKMATMGILGSKRHPKGIQKACKRVPKGTQKA